MSESNFPVPVEEVPAWALNHSLDLLVQALEMVEDIAGCVSGWEIAEQVMYLAPGPEAEQMARVWAALTTVARSVQAAREEARRGNQD